MRWITRITIDNYRAFPRLYEKIVLPPGNHLLIYGENGSGKSSLYNAVGDFFESSSNPAKQFETNLFSRTAGDTTGSITLEISEIDNQGAVTSHTDYSFSGDPAIAANTNQAFIQIANKIKGFLDYKRLLRTYLIETPSGQNPNIFLLLVEELLSEYQINRGAGLANVELLAEWKRLFKAVRTDNRTAEHRGAKAELPHFEQELKRILNAIFPEFNRIIQTYFDPKLQINVTVSQLVYNPGRNSVATEIALGIKYAGVDIPSYQIFLNEARLSALALSLYLVSIKSYPLAATDLRVLYLDDVFIGLDMSNRIPLLNILQNEFVNQGFQIFISTYDRFWFELAQRHFNGQMPGKWKYYEMYKSRETIGGVEIEKPLIVQSENNFNKAVYYLHHGTKPDYPAASNYFRKYAEELLQNYTPGHEFRNIDDYSTLKTHKLGQYVVRTIQFLDKIGVNKNLTLQLEQSLPTLMHPLSHYDLSAPVYKGELIRLQTLLEELPTFLAELAKRVRVLIPEGRDIKLIFVPTPNLSGVYKINLLETIYLVNDGGGATHLSKARCRTETCYDMANGVKEHPYSPRADDNTFQYESLNDAYTKIYNFIVAQPNFMGIQRSVNYSTEFEYAQDQNLVRLNTLMIW